MKIMHDTKSKKVCVVDVIPTVCSNGCCFFNPDTLTQWHLIYRNS